MTRNINHTSSIKIHEQQIQPWNAEESTQLNPIESTMIQYFHTVNRHSISFNPQIHKQSEKKTTKPIAKGHNFFDNLRRYEKKKAEEILLKKDVNFIQKNKQKIVEDFGISPPQTKNNNLLMSNLFLHDKKCKKVEEYTPPGVQPINWSLIMYYETQKNKRKPRHKDIQSFLRFLSQKKGRETMRQSTQNSQLNQQNLNRFEQDKFQKILKLKEGIRRRNLRSASSSSKQNFDGLQPSADELRKSHNIDHRVHGMVEFQKNIVPKTIFSARFPRKNEVSPCKIQVVGSKNTSVRNKQPRADLRMIHSSQKNRPLNQLLNIHGNKVQSSKKINKNL